METQKFKKLNGGGVSLRDSGIELFRIITMLLIVAHHYVVNSGLMDEIAASPFQANAIFLLIFGAWGKTGINCFVLITGYFMCRSRMTLKRLLKLVLEVEFYKIVFWLIFLLSGYEPFSWGGLKLALLPVHDIGGDFINCYLPFLLFIPFLNILIKNMDGLQHLLLIGLCLAIYTVLATVPKIGVTMNHITWYIVLYFIASYIRLHPLKMFQNRKLWGFAALGSVAVSIGSIFVCAWYNRKYDADFPYYYFLSDSNKIFAVTTAVCAFLFFKNIHFHSRAVNMLASTTLGVLLIHANSNAMRRWLWQDVLDNVGHFGSHLLAIHAIVSVLAVYLIATAIDLVRIYCLEKPFFGWWEKRSGKRKKAGERGIL